MPVWGLLVLELQVQRLLVLERSTQQGQPPHLLQRAWVLVQGSGGVHPV